MEVHIDSHNTLTENVKSCTQDISQKYVSRKDHVFFIENEIEKRRILDRCCQYQNKSSIIEVFSSEDIFEDDLLESKIFFKEEKIKKSKGRLFSDESITLILDFTKINPYQVPGLNDLLDSPAHFQGETVHPSVQRIFFIHKEQLTSCFKSLSPDFWNRIRKIIFLSDDSIDHLTHGKKKLSIEMQAHYLSNKQLVSYRCCIFKEKNYDELVDTKIKKINFNKIGFTWQFSLKGGICLNEKGKIEFNHSILANLSKGDCVILHDAPWENEQFVNSLAAIMRYNGYRSNGQWISVPEDVQFTKTQTDFDRIMDLKKCLIHSQDFIQDLSDQSSVVLLNHELFDEILMNTVQIDDDHNYHSINPIKHLLQDCTNVLITNDLTDHQWLCLLKEIEEQSQKINIIVEKEHIHRLNMNENIKNYICDNEEEMLSHLAKNSDVYHITSSDQWNELWYKTHFMSYKNRLLKQEKTPLLQALIEGRHVVLYGLENNPFLIACFESLLMNPSCLFIQGKKVKLPKINLTILWKRNSASNALHQNFLWNKVCESMRKKNINKKEDQTSVKLKKIFNLIQYIPTDKNDGIFFDWNDRDFKKIFDQQVLLEKQQDEAIKTIPFHQRKALYTLFVKKYRDDDNIIGYLKAHIRCLYPDDEEEKANKNSLQSWLEEHKNVNRQILRSHFWSLVRHCPVDKCKLYDEYDYVDEKTIDMISYYLLGIVSIEKRKKLAMQLDVSADNYAKNDEYYDGNIRKCLYNSLFIAGNENRKSKESISLQVKKIEEKIYRIFLKKNNEKKSILQIEKELKRFFKSKILNHDLKELSLNLFHSKNDHHLNYLCRLKKLASRIDLHPLVFLQGPTGAGKSYIAKSVYDELQKKEQWRNMPPPLFLSLGAETTREFLYGSEVLVKKEDGDKKSQWEEGPILQWAMNPNPPLLILDEANLVKEGILAPLVGLVLNRPQLCIYGRKYELTQKHRVILTGNSHRYSGRHMDSTLQKKLMTFYCRPLSKEILAKHIIEKNLPSQFSNEEKQYIQEIILFLYDQFSKILPVISPRDLYQVLSSILYILSYHKGDTISKEQMHYLVWISFEENFYMNVKNYDYLSALKIWYQIHYELDSSVDFGNKEAFQKFLISFKSSSNHQIMIETQSIEDLIYMYWSFLEKQERFDFTKKGLIVEGPSGWGKDAIFKAVFNHWKQKYTEQELLMINANLYEWPEQEQQIKKAMSNGQKILISELNILSSSNIEGLFNHILTSSYKKGFSLIATINPSSFKGREELSFAMKNRCQYIHLSPLTEQEILQILQYHCKNIDLCDFFSQRSYFLSETLQLKDSAIKITRSHLLDCIHLAQKEDKEKWGSVFQKCYSLELFCLDLDFQKFEKKFHEKNILKNQNYLKRQHKLSFFINKKSDKPIIVKLFPEDIYPKWCALTSTLILPDNECEDELKKLASSVLNYNEGSLVARNVKKFHDITRKKYYSSVQYFSSNKFTISDYRLKIIDIDSDLNEKVVDCAEGDIEFLYPLESLDYIIGLEEYQLGAGSFTIQKSQWTSIPGISSKDKLIFLACDEKIDLEIAQSKITGQILIREVANDTVHEIHIKFIIKPDKELLSFSSSDMNNLEVDRISCDPDLHRYLDEEVFSYRAKTFLGCCELQKIHKIPNIFLKLEELAKWCQSFGTMYNICGNGREYLVNLIKSKQGNCLQRTYVYKIISQYFGVRTRVINNIVHRYIEVSFNNGKIWKKINLGGGRRHQHEVNIFKPDYPVLSCASKKKEISVFIGDKKQFINLVLSFMNKELNQKTRQDLWNEIENIILNYTVDTITYVAVLVDNIEYFLLNNFPILNLIIKFFSSLRERNEKDKRATFIIESNAILFTIELHELWKKKLINDNDYNNLLDLYLFLIIKFLPRYPFLTLLHEIVNENFCRKQEIFARHLNIQYRFIKNKRVMKVDFSGEIELKKSCYQGYSQTLIHELMKEKNELSWANYSAGGLFNSNRYIEGKPAFQIKKTVDKQRSVYLPIFFGRHSNLLSFLVMKLMEQLVQNRIDEFIIKKLDEISCTLSQEDVMKLYCDIIEDFLLYFLDKVYPTLNFMITNVRHNCFEVPVGIYHKFTSLQNKKVVERLCIERDNINNCYLNIRYLSFEIIKEIMNDPSALFITEDLLILCFHEYLQTMNWDLVK